MYLHIKNKAKLSTPARPLNIWLFFYLDFKVCIVKKFNKNKRTNSQRLIISSVHTKIQPVCLEGRFE